MTTLDPQVRALLERTAVSTISSALRKRGHVDVFVDGVTPSRPGARMVGVARTLRLLPYRKDLFETHGGGYNAQKQVIDALGAGEVLVVEARGVRDAGTIGDVLATRAKDLGAAGVVTDGAVRDLAPVAEIGLPVFSQGGHPAVLGRRHVPWEYDVAVACGGAAVLPGDVIVGDDDGVVVIPAALVAEVAVEAEAQEREDAWVAGQVAAGNAVRGLFPPNEEWRRRYREHAVEEETR